MTSEDQSRGAGRVLRFERRGVTSLRGRTPFAVPPSPVKDLRKHAHRNEDAEEHRHRMVANGLAMVILVLLVGFGIWLADAIIRMRDSQDCALSGRTNCAPIQLPIQGQS
jgi:hypothetical protein